MDGGFEADLGDGGKVAEHGIVPGNDVFVVPEVVAGGSVEKKTTVTLVGIVGLTTTI